MFHLITGGSGSGKSVYAEEQVLRMSRRPGQSEEQALRMCGQSEEQALRMSRRLVQNKGREEISPRIYIATMKPYGEETMEKIERHQKQRARKGFVTVECYTGLSGIRLPENSGVLLECVSNLAANELYREDGSMRDRQRTTERILEGVRNLLRQTENLVVVTNEVGADAEDYSPGTREYIALLGEVNQGLSRMADQVTEVVYGIPVPLKR